MNQKSTCSLKNRNFRLCSLKLVILKTLFNSGYRRSDVNPYALAMLIALLIAFPILSYEQLPDSALREGNASYYHDGLHGLETSNGEVYDKDDFTAAHRTLPFNTLLLVTNRKNNKNVIVRVNDRGPFKRSRIIDLSRSAAKKIGMIPFGVVPVKIIELKFLNIYPIDDSLLNEDEIWDCYGNKKTLSGNTVFAWTTEFWQHAFYMASSLTLDYNTDSIVLRISEKNDRKNYQVLFTGLDNSVQADSLVKLLKKDGFANARKLRTS